MSVSVVWGIDGLAGGLLLLLVTLFMLGSGVVSVSDARRGWGERWLSHWRGYGWFPGGLVALVFTVGFLTAAFHQRTVTLTVAHLESTGGRSASFTVEDADGHRYSAGRPVYDELSEGDSVRCRATVALFVKPTLLSCVRVRAL
jgi:hypothetical protein